MVTLSNKVLEKAFDKKIIPNITCLGVDTASRTGWCKATTTKKEVVFDYGFIDVKSNNKYFKYNRYIKLFSNIVKTDKLIIEESFYGRNVKTFQMLSRLGGFIYAIAHLNGQKDKEFLLATTARKQLGFKGNLKKQLIHQQFLKTLKLKLDDEDVIDAMVLAINGILDHENTISLPI